MGFKKADIFFGCIARQRIHRGIKAGTPTLFRFFQQFIGIIVAVLNQVLIRAGREEQAMMTTLAGIIVVLMMMISRISTLFDTVKDTFGL